MLKYLVPVFIICLYSPSILADELFVGGSEYPKITDALQAASEGDVITIGPGRYEESIETTRSGLTIRAEPLDGEVLVTNSGRVLRISHPNTYTIACNFKDNVCVLIDRVTAYDSEIMFRLRGPTDSRPRELRSR